MTRCSKNYFGDNVLTLMTDNRIDFAFPPDAVANASQRDFLKKHIGDCPFVTVKQVHGNKVIVARSSTASENLQEADSIVTHVKDLAICVRTADCLSVLIYDPIQKAIAAVHAGWQSTQKEILRKTIEQMTSSYQTQAKDLRVCFGPSICGNCYEVGEEFKNYFPNDLTEKNGQYYFSVSQANKRQLLELGVLPANITESDLCTFEDKTCFSYRQGDKDTGRMLSLIMLKSEA